MSLSTWEGKERVPKTKGYASRKVKVKNHQVEKTHFLLAHLKRLFLSLLSCFSHLRGQTLIHPLLYIYIYT